MIKTILGWSGWITSFVLLAVQAYNEMKARKDRQQRLFYEVMENADTK